MACHQVGEIHPHVLALAVNGRCELAAEDSRHHDEGPSFEVAARARNALPGGQAVQALVKCVAQVRAQDCRLFIRRVQEEFGKGVGVSRLDAGNVFILILCVHRILRIRIATRTTLLPP